MLAFALPAFMRIAWTSAAIRAGWEPLIEQAGAELRLAMVNSVVAGQLESVILPLAPFEVPAAMARLTDTAHSLAVLGDECPERLRPLWAPPTSVALWCYVGPHPGEAAAAWRTGEPGAVAAHASIPHCCADPGDRRALDREWALTSADEDDWRRNYLFLRLGVMPTLHIPCSAACGSDFASRAGISIPTTETFLKLPARWSALHGIAEVVTPLFRMVFDSVATADLHSRQRGRIEDAPAQCPTGTMFPFPSPSGRSVANTASFARGLANADALPPLGFGEVERLALQSLVELPERPAFFTDVMNDWAALERWSPDFLRGRLGSRRVNLRDRLAGDEISSTLEAFLDQILEGGDLADWYLFGLRFEQEAPEMLQDFNVPELLASWHHLSPAQEQAAFRAIFIGGAGTITPLHKEALDTATWMAVIWGRKRWAFCPPTSDSRVLRECPDLFDPETRSRLSREGISITLCEQHAGDFLFVPSGWWHQVQNLEPTLGLSDNVINAANADRIEREAQKSHPDDAQILVRQIRQALADGRRLGAS
jgi:hypothetical protein